MKTTFFSSPFKVLIAAGIFLYFSAVSAGGETYNPGFGLHADGIGLVYDLGGPARFAAAAHSKGYLILLVNLMPDFYYFSSPTLASLNYRFGEDLLTPLVTGAHAHDLQIFVDIRLFYSRGVWWDNLNPLDLTDDLMGIFTDPVATFIQTAGVIPHQSPRWLAGRASLGLNQSPHDYVSDTSTRTILPERGIYRSSYYTHFNPGPYESSMGWMEISDAPDAAILSTGARGGYAFALLTGRGINTS